MQSYPSKPARQPWSRKFACALRGLVVGVRGQSSFAVHLPAGLLVVAAAWWLQVSALEWALLMLCISLVLSAELLNSSIESLASRITQATDPTIRDALDMASGAVLLVALGAAVAGLLVLGRQLLLACT
jgi:diacylglycerol kinase